MSVYKLLKKTEKLVKGIASKKYPYDPALDDSSLTTGDWVIDQDSDARETIPRMEGAARFRGLNKLRAKTHTRKNPTTGENEYLLHRGMSSQEHKAHTQKPITSVTSKTSWTPNKYIADDFSAEYSKTFKKGVSTSAWIPESQIHHMPYMHSHAPSMKTFRDEHEVIVNPHQINFNRVEPFSQKLIDGKYYSSENEEKKDNIRNRVSELKKQPKPNLDKSDVADLELENLTKSSGNNWQVKIKGMDGYHPLKDIQDLGPEKGNNYILHDGRAFHQDHVEDVDMTGKQEFVDRRHQPIPHKAHSEEILTIPDTEVIRVSSHRWGKK